MKTIYVRLLVSLFALAVLAGGARAQAVDQINMTIGHDFVVAGKTLPAGTYKVFRASSSNTSALVMNSVENRTGAIVIATGVELSQGEATHARFQVVGDQYVLTEIETLQHVFTIPVSNRTAQELAAKQGNDTVTSVRSK